MPSDQLSQPSVIVAVKFNSTASALGHSHPWLWSKPFRIPSHELSARSGSSNNLDLLVTASEVPMYDDDLSSRIRMSNSLPHLISSLLIYAVRGHRLENQAKPLVVLLIFTAAMFC
ncbi:hypothetical protein BKA60DRAFT_571783 [Fusarium oxysporum]|nr:hypothetical protein BKA60DRAFT_571783 [Fusarium oxysporum]